MFGITDFPESYPQIDLVEQVTLEDVTSSAGAAEAIKVPWDPEEPEAAVTRKVREMIAKRCWWLQEYWCAKGPPAQHLVVTGPSLSLHIYVFGQTMEKAYRDTIVSVARMFAQVREGIVFRNLSYVLFDDTGYVNSQNGQSAVGWAGGHDYIVLFPGSRSFAPYRIAGITRFEGALIHEIAHKVLKADAEVVRSGERSLHGRWCTRFGWTALPAEGSGRVLPGGCETWAVIEDPARCVNDYARCGPGDDFCESLAAALRVPAVLDPERFQFLRDEVLPTSWHEVPITICEADTNPPVLRQPVAFSRQRTRLRRGIS